MERLPLNRSRWLEPTFTFACLLAQTRSRKNSQGNRGSAKGSPSCAHLRCRNFRSSCFPTAFDYSLYRRLRSGFPQYFQAFFAEITVGQHFILTFAVLPQKHLPNVEC